MRLKAIIEDPIKNYFQKVAKAESGNNPKAKNPNGSATGLYQFTDGTFNGLNQKYKLGLKPDDRTNPEKAEKLMEVFTRENESYLKPKIGRDLNDADRYMAHFLGAQGAAKFLQTYSANPNAPISSVMNQKALDSNRGVVYNKDGSLKTVADVYGWAARKMNASVEASPKSIENRTIIFVPELPPLEKQEIQAKENLEIKQEAEMVQTANPLQEYFNQQQIVQQQVQQPQEQEVQEPEFNLAQTYAQIDQFVEGQVFQKGGKIQPRDERYEAVTSKSTIQEPRQKEKHIKEINAAIDDREAILNDEFNKPKSALYKNRGKFKDKGTQEFFDKVKNTVTPRQYQRLLDIQARIGNPEININSNSGLPLSNPNANYNILTDEINIGNNKKHFDKYVRQGLLDEESRKYYETDDLIGRYLQEASHAPQSNSDVIPQWLANDLPAYIFSKNNRMEEKTLNEVSDDDLQNRDVYTKKGTVENYTHSVIEPILFDYYRDGQLLSLPNFQKGGQLYNPELEKNEQFQKWYSENTIEGQNKIPYSSELDYDYLSYYMNGDYKNYEGGHFPDTYKKPNHETFSVESLYSVPENPGGSWNGNTFIPHFQKGGVIYVNDTNHPRYKKYIDSLTAYNQGRLDNSVGNTRYGNPSGHIVNDLDWQKQTQEDIKNFGQESLGATEKQFLNKGIQPLSYDLRKTGDGTQLYPNYKYPTQKVIVGNKPQIRENQIPLSINQVQALYREDTTPATEYEVLPPANVPQYYDVIDTVNQNFGGSETRYRTNDLNSLRELAPEPYNSRQITPRYQIGGVIKDDMGQWKYPGEITQINSPHITMKGVNYPVLGRSLETGEEKLMMPNMEYYFDKTKNVLEIPL